VITSRATRMLRLAMVCLIGTACGTAVHSTDTATPNATGLPGTPSAASTATSTPRSPPRSSTSHPPVVVILMENEESSSVVGNTTGAPYISKTLIPSGTLFTNYYAVSHPSLPNYLALTVGNTCGKDGTDTVTPLCTEPSIWTQMSAAGIIAREWAENESANCSYTSDGTGLYAQRHDSYAIVADAEALSTCGDLATGTGSSSPGLAALDAALASASPPAYSFVTPNLCDDMHSCPIRSGDLWLSANVPGLLRAGVDVIVTFDEGTSNTNGGGQVMTVEVGPGVAAGAKNGTLYAHYGLLAGIEKHFGLPLLSNARTATPLPIGGSASSSPNPLPSLLKIIPVLPACDSGNHDDVSVHTNLVGQSQGGSGHGVSITASASSSWNTGTARPYSPISRSTHAHRRTVPPDRDRGPDPAGRHACDKDEHVRRRTTRLDGAQL